MTTPPHKSYHGSIHSTKPPFVSVRGFMGASLRLHNMGLFRWAYLLTIRDPADWVLLLKMSNSVRSVMFLSPDALVKAEISPCCPFTYASFKGADLFGWRLQLRES
jgi:hypothetical protein